jgi:hypothetical protein
VKCLCHVGAPDDEVDVSALSSEAQKKAGMNCFIVSMREPGVLYIQVGDLDRSGLCA